MERCVKHPKYDGKKKPLNECVDCLRLYASMLRPRIPTPPPTIQFKDKTKYTRKKKHKNRHDSE